MVSQGLQLKYKASIGIFNFQDQKINRESGKFQEENYKLQNRDLKILAMSEN